ncbi:hypothetical protein [Dyadobacter sandarakinus]|uniref:DUF4249 family protein n=1 Tax=Dyadobacter sandarakinus TaxID=2747268 RepID=A0ABX7IBJ8_9BACT|nr:hypothetical protein [Dyadobacter sandarakinus]QRR03188.1 hypothetical protein HWI92_20860 [Dyadobacter sandarakinus]
MKSFITKHSHSQKWALAVLGCFVTGLLSCEDYREAEPIFTEQVKVINLNRDTLIAVYNEKLATTARVSFVETLSDTALVKIASDTVFSKPQATFLLPITNPPLMLISGLSGDSLFIKYEPYKKVITGDLTIEITFQR